MRPRQTYVAWRAETRENIGISTILADERRQATMTEPIPSTRVV